MVIVAHGLATGRTKSLGVNNCKDVIRVDK